MKICFFTTCLLLLLVQANSHAQISKHFKIDSLYSKGTFGISSMLFNQAPKNTVQQTVGEQYVFFQKRPYTNYRYVIFSARIPIKNNWGIGLSYAPLAALNGELITINAPEGTFDPSILPHFFMPYPRKLFGHTLRYSPEYSLNAYHIKALNEKIGILSSVGMSLSTMPRGYGFLMESYWRGLDNQTQIYVYEFHFNPKRQYIFSLDLRCQVAMRTPNMSVLTIGPWLHYNREPVYSTFEFLEPAIENKGTIGRSTAFLGIEVSYELSRHALKYASAYKKAQNQSK